MSVLVIDNYDSFTYNLYQLLCELGAAVTVARNDAIDLDAIEAMKPDHIVLSPGPGSPDRPRDFGVCAPVITRLGPRVPLLGVCLGHQGIVHHLGGEVGRAPRPMHGKVSTITHDGSPLFAGLDPRVDVMRYHSLLATRVPACLRVTARTDDDLVMAVEHTSWPVWGVQFHPESVGTPAGRQILANFLQQRAR